MVANRLPVTCSKDAAGRWKLQISAGGLVSALMGVNNYSTLWIGWPGAQQQQRPRVYDACMCVHDCSWGRKAAAATFLARHS